MATRSKHSYSPRVRMAGWAEIPLSLVRDRERLLHRLQRDLVFQTADTREFTGSDKDNREKVILFEKDEETLRVPRYYLERLEDLLEPGAASWENIEDARATGIGGQAPGAVSLFTGPTHMEFRGALKDDPNKNQVEGSEALQDSMGGILVAAPGKGKCHPRGTLILMFDGTTKPVEQIQVGDRLMGPDSLPRTVTATGSGYGPLYQVNPKKGEPWGCNAEHILSLKSSRRFPGEAAKLPFWGFPEVWDVPLNEFIQCKEYAKHHWKLWRSPGVEFGGSVGYPIAGHLVSPYFLGVLLGDGGLKGSPTVTAADPEIVETLKVQAKAFGFSWPLRTEDATTGRAKTYFFTNTDGRGIEMSNPLINCLRAAGVWGMKCEEKAVPQLYKSASRQARLQILAGLLDTDGALNYEGYDFCVKSKQLAEDVAFLARSLGLGASFSRPREVDGVLYYRVRIYGDCSVIPVRIPRKKAKPRRQKKDVLVTGFDVELIGEGEYFGFTLAEDPHYLLGDFTVCHNTVMAIHAACAVDRRTLVVVPTEALLDQWIKRVQQFTNLTRGEIGVVQGDACQWNRPFIVAMVQSLSQKEYPEQLYQSVGIFITDEVHRIGAPTWLQVVPRFPAMYRWGLSATPERPDGMHRAFKLHIGDIVYEMLELDSQPVVYQILTGTQLAQRDIVNAWNGKTNFSKMYTALSRDSRRNNLIAQEVKNCTDHGRKSLVLSKRVQHLGALYHLALQKGVPADKMGTIVGPEKNKGDRIRILSTRKVIWASEQIAGLGLDQPDLDTLHWALPSQAVEQNVGRIERVDVQKKPPIAFDYVDDVPMLRRLAQSRLKKFRQRGYKVVVVDRRNFGR